MDEHIRKKEEETIEEHLKKVLLLERQRWQRHEMIKPYTLEMLSILEKALLLDPTNLDILTNLGAVYSDMGKHDKALRILLKVERMGSEDKNLFRNIGIALMNLSKLDLAKDYLNKATGMNVRELTYEAYADYGGY